VQHIPDPSMNNMNAFAITIPAGWRFDGILMPSGDCTSGPFVVYRAKSPRRAKQSGAAACAGLVLGNRASGPSQGE